MHCYAQIRLHLRRYVVEYWGNISGILLRSLHISRGAGDLTDFIILHPWTSLKSA